MLLLKVFLLPCMLCEFEFAQNMNESGFKAVMVAADTVQSEIVVICDEPIPYKKIVIRLEDVN